MEENIKKGYIAGIGCVLASSIFLIITLNSGWNLTGQILTVFTIIFGILGIGSLIKPSSFGEITNQILENIAKNAQEKPTKSFSQKGGQNSKNIQGDSVTYNETHYHGK